MEGFVVDIGAEACSNVVPIALGLSHLAKMLLFVSNVVFGACNNTLALNALDCGCNEGSCKIGVGTESFLERCQHHHPWYSNVSTHPISSAFRRAA